MTVHRCVAFLGGINVGGHRVTMETLRSEFAAIGFADVGTFIASGNVTFSTDDLDVEPRIEARLRESLGYAVPTWVRTASAVVALPEACPLPTEGGSVYVGFLRGAPVGDVAELETPVDTLRVVGRELWWRVEGGLMDSQIKSKDMGRVLGAMTTRNLNTVRRLAAKLRSS